jgi:hypothetical protein
MLPFLSESNSESSMLRSELLAAIQREIQSHDFPISLTIHQASLKVAKALLSQAVQDAESEFTR